MKLSQKSMTVLILLILFGGIFVSDAFGYWQTESSKVPAKFQTGEFAGQADPSDIRGSYTFGDIARVFPIEVDVLAEAFAVVDDPEDFQLKSLEVIYPSDGEIEMGTASVRYFVARYTGLPYEVTGEEALFSSAVRILKQEGKIDEAEALDIPVIRAEINLLYENGGQSESAEEHVEPLVKGNTTIADLFALGLTETQIVDVTGPYDSKGQLVRDTCKNNGLVFSEIKAILIEMIEE